MKKIIFISGANIDSSWTYNKNLKKKKHFSFIEKNKMNWWNLPRTENSSEPFNSKVWPRKNFSLQYQYKVKQISSENKEKCQLENY